MRVSLGEKPWNCVIKKLVLGVAPPCSWSFQEAFLKIQDCRSVPAFSWRRDWRLAPEYLPNCSCGSPVEEGHEFVDFLESQVLKEPSDLGIHLFLSSINTISGSWKEIIRFMQKF